MGFLVIGFIGEILFIILPKNQKLIQKILGGLSCYSLQLV
jgi:hypothetical protein